MCDCFDIVVHDNLIQYNWCVVDHVFGILLGLQLLDRLQKRLVALEQRPVVLQQPVHLLDLREGLPDVLQLRLERRVGLPHLPVVSPEPVVVGLVGVLVLPLLQGGRLRLELVQRRVVRTLGLRWTKAYTVAVRRVVAIYR